MYTADNPGQFRGQGDRFEAVSPWHPLLRSVPHVAFKVADLQEAIHHEDVIPGTYETIDGFLVAMPNDAGVLIDLLQAELTDDELWRRARPGEGLDSVTRIVRRGRIAAQKCRCYRRPGKYTGHR